MNVSGAYAWTKGNHIDDQVSKIGQMKNVSLKSKKLATHGNTCSLQLARIQKIIWLS